ncbi:phosphotransferase enzyme family protein-like protein [Aaosphaeria arxii CBS 175.79]|uniref:Phosphotransferase enzyme family protein-like protein n=1 Tax=Aaosphaeria arxii CBS 175.79 TaxID=1450172 RepID=A0A6A5XZ75_9PLEO|nr:phosphotransferase enzyme family protein-like protein [Aaosphaeria arxii CBS 175.79]KAF2017930.1 phosphotransferase enzyme family protein-like protein [Aaosphaeria arxii CBS 175.79]
MSARVLTAEELSKAVVFGDFMAVYKVDEKTVVKKGEGIRMAEAHAMRLVSEKTTVPVLEVFNAYTDPESGHVHIVMEFVEGDVLSNVWDKLNSDQQNEITEQLRDYVSQLRQIKGSFIGSTDGTACEDQLFTDILGGYGPYENEKAFNQGIVTAFRNTSQGGWIDLVCDMVLSLKDHEIILTHGDLSPRNIIVQGSKVKAVLDWEMTGYYPEYWEYAKAMYRLAWVESWITGRNIEKIMDQYLSELAILLNVRTIVW